MVAGSFVSTGKVATMKRIKTNNPNSVVTLASAAADANLVLPPTVVGNYVKVPTHWAAAGESVAKFVLSVFGSAAIAVTNALIAVGVFFARTVADDAVEVVTAASDALTLTAHGYTHGYGPVQLTTTGTLPAGSALATNYWLIYVDANNVKLAASLDDVLAGTAVDLTDAGSGTHTIVAQSGASDLKWVSLGKLGDAKDGAFALTLDKGYSVPVDNHPRAAYYAIAGDIDTGTINATIEPYIEV